MLRLAFALIVAFLGLISSPVSAGEVRVWSTPPRCPTAPARLVVVGDSLADGMWGAFYRRYAKCSEMEVVRLTTVSDGLAKSSPDEWLNRVAARAGANDIFLVQLGTNDLTNIRDGRERHVHGSETWADAYSQRMNALARGLLNRGAAVFWYGLPIVGRNDIREDIEKLTFIQSAALQDTGVIYIDTYEKSQFGTGDYAIATTVDGKPQRVRADDRVHFTTVGYELLAEAALSQLEPFILAHDQKEHLNGLALQ